MGPGAIGPASPFAGLMADLPAHLGTGWQSLDLCVRCYKNALRSTDFQKLPSVVAVVQSQLNALQKLITAYTSGTTGGAASSPSASPSSMDAAEASTTSADADSMPSAPSEDAQAQS